MRSEAPGDVFAQARFAPAAQHRRVWIAGRHAGTLVVALLLSACTLGCAAFETCKCETLLTARLEDGTTVTLQQDVHSSMMQRGAAHNAARLSAWFQPAGQAGGTTYLIADRGFDDWQTVRGFEFGPLEARADAAQQRVWWIDTASRAVVAALDRHDGRRAGPAETPPAWATLDGGRVLDAVALR